MLKGLDLKKDEEFLHHAYRNTCREWYFYLFDKINRDLKADFDKNLFDYYTEYLPKTGEYRWFFISKATHIVNLFEPSVKIKFKKGEKIFIGRSFKFDEKEVVKMANSAGLIL